MGETCPVCGGQACGESRTDPPPLPIGVKASIDTIATVLGVDPGDLTVTGWECGGREGMTPTWLTAEDGSLEFRVDGICRGRVYWHVDEWHADTGAPECWTTRPTQDEAKLWVEQQWRRT